MRLSFALGIEFSLIKEAANYLRVLSPVVPGTPGDHTCLFGVRARALWPLSVLSEGAAASRLPSDLGLQLLCQLALMCLQQNTWRGLVVSPDVLLKGPADAPHSANHYMLHIKWPDLGVLAVSLNVSEWAFYICISVFQRCEPSNPWPVAIDKSLLGKHFAKNFRYAALGLWQGTNSNFNNALLPVWTKAASERAMDCTDLCNHRTVDRGHNGQKQLGVCIYWFVTLLSMELHIVGQSSVSGREERIPSWTFDSAHHWRDHKPGSTSAPEL